MDYEISSISSLGKSANSIHNPKSEEPTENLQISTFELATLNLNKFLISYNFTCFLSMPQADR